MSAKNSSILRKHDGLILVRPSGDPLCGMTSGEFLTVLRSRLEDRVTEAWIFGSFATGTMHHYSDIDVLLVTETTLGFVDRPSMYDDLLGIGPDLDLLVYTPSEWHSLTTDPTVGFWKSVVRTMIRIL